MHVIHSCRDALLTFFTSPKCKVLKVTIKAMDSRPPIAFVDFDSRASLAAALDKNGTSLNHGDSSTVSVSVAVQKASAKALSAGLSSMSFGKHDDW